MKPTASNLKYYNQTITLNAPPKKVTLPQSRGLFGDLAEIYAEQLLGAKRIVTQPGFICPDMVGDDIYYEVKSIGCHRSILMDVERVENYDRFMDKGNKLYYVFVMHDMRFKPPHTVDSFTKLYAMMVNSVLIVEGRTMHRRIRRCLPYVHMHREKWRIYKKDFDRYWKNCYNSKLALPIDINGCETPAVQVKWLGDDFTDNDVFGDTSIFKIMQFDLNQQHLDVVLKAAEHPKFPGHCVRSTIDTNQGWYQDLCATYSRCNGRDKWETLIVRADIKKMLSRLIEGKYPGTVNINRVWPYAKQIKEELDNGSMATI